MDAVWTRWSRFRVRLPPLLDCMTGRLGSAGSFSIKRNLELGHYVRTAVVEVQLYASDDADTARAIAVALREACAIELGIAPDEMGFVATPALTPAERSLMRRHL